MFKLALFDCAITEKCCSVDGGRSICPFFSSPPRGFDSLRVPTHGNLPFKAKILIPGSQPGGEGWVQVELTDALHFCLIPANHFLIEAIKFVSLSLFTFLI